MQVDNNTAVDVSLTDEVSLSKNNVVTACIQHGNCVL